MALNVGELVAYLRLDMGDFDKGMASAQARADKLDGKDVDVKVKADTASAETKMTEAQATADKLDSKTVDVKVKADTASAETKMAALAASEERVGKSSVTASLGMATVEKAARKLEDATNAVILARLRVSDFEEGGAAKTSTLVAADMALAKAERNLVDAQNEVDGSNKKIAKSGQDAGRGMGAIVAAVLLLGPALVPIIQATVGLGFGFGAMGVAGVLAIVGIVQEIKAGTVVGVQFSAMLATLKGDLTTLGAAAARGVLGPFQASVAVLQSQMPALNGLIGEFSTITGKAAGVLVNGLVAAMISLAPLGRDASVYILTLTQRFAGLMSGQGVVAFGDYVRSVFPQVMQAIGSIVGAFAHLLDAIAPLGLGALTILQDFGDLINAIPTNVLAVLIQLASSVYIGFQAWKLLSGPIDALSASLKLNGVPAALQSVGISAETAAAGVRTLTIAAGVIGAVLAVATLVYSAFADSQRQNTQAANDFADAIRADNGALGENTRAMAAKKLQDSGALELGRALGLSMSTLTDYTLGNAAAVKEVTAVLNSKFGPAVASNGAQMTDAQQKAIKLGEALNGTSSEVGAGAEKQKELAAATATTTATVDPARAAQDAFAVSIGTTSAALATATTGQQTTADAAANAAAKMYVENDAAGILKSSLDTLNGKALNAAQAQNSFDSALANMGDHITTTGKKITFTTTSIGDMSTASVALRGQLNSQVTDLQNVVEANGGLSDSTGKARAQMVTMRQQIIDNAVAHGVNRDAVTAYVDKLLAIPATIPPTKLDIDAAHAAEVIAGIKAQVASIAAQPIVLSFTANYSAAVSTALAAARANIVLNLPGHAGGGLLTGPGSGTSDSILGVTASGVPIARVSPGEFVVTAAATAKNRALLDAINSGQQGSAGGGGGSGGPIRIDPGDMNALTQMMLGGAQTIALGLGAGNTRNGDNTRTTQNRRW